MPSLVRPLFDGDPGDAVGSTTVEALVVEPACTVVVDDPGGDLGVEVGEMEDEDLQNTG